MFMSIANDASVPWPKETEGRVNSSSEFTTLSRQQFRRYFQPSRLVLCLMPAPTESGVNVITVSFNMYCSYKPPMMSFAIQNINESWNLIRRADECVLSVPGESMAKESMLSGFYSAKDCDKVKKLNLELCPSEEIKVPGLKRAIANVELGSLKHIETGDHSLMVGTVLRFAVKVRSRELPLLSIGPDTRGYKVLQQKGIHRIGIVDIGPDGL
jgi:flavin reductase (DIM6/NTAB) family NADH-FMN oxidoreductase RutF